MAGRGSRFVKAGYSNPKPFIDVAGTPMIQRVVENLMPYEPHRFIFLARREHEPYIKTCMSFATDVIYVDEVTDGAACTVLLAKDLINSDDSLIIANSDQLVEWNDSKRLIDLENSRGSTIWVRETNSIQDMINWAIVTAMDAMIATFNASHPKWSYAKVKNNLVEEVAEKKVISNDATVGIYWYKYGRHFVTCAEQMIKKDIRINNEFYVCPVFNEMVGDFNRRVGIYPVRTMAGLGTPEDLEKYLHEG